MWSRIKGAAKKAAKKVVKTVVDTAKKVVKTVAKGVKGGLSYIGNGAKKVYSSFKSYASEKQKKFARQLKEKCVLRQIEFLQLLEK